MKVKAIARSLWKFRVFRFWYIYCFSDFSLFYDNMTQGKTPVNKQKKGTASVKARISSQKVRQSFNVDNKG